MIKFFRKIRQNLLSEGKTGKYLKYAIGEIVLVVIGILIALSINNWNTHNKIKKDNEIYLKKMKSELELNITRLNFLLYDDIILTGDHSSLENAVRGCDSLLKLISVGLESKDVEFIITGQFHNGGSYFNLHDATYDELMNTSKLYTLGSDTLTNAIKKYYKRYEREVMYNKKYTDYALEGLNLTNASIKKLRLDKRLNPDSFDIQNYPWFFDKNSEEYLKMEIGVEKMLKGQRQDYMKCLDLILESKHLIDVINYELESVY